MYLIKCDNDIIYSPSLNYDISGSKLTLEANKAGTLIFDIYNTHPYYDNLIHLKSEIKVYKKSNLIWKGRMVPLKSDFDNVKQVECEGKLSYLNDSIFRPFEFQGSPEELFNQIIDTHNAQTVAYQKFKKGIVTVTDPNNYIVRSSKEYKTCWEVLNEKLVKMMGGYLIIRYEEDGDYLDWIKEPAGTINQNIEFGENLLDFSRIIDASETYTAVLPLGAKLSEEGSEETGGESEKRLDITSVNDDLDYLVNNEMANVYGVVYAPISKTTWNNVTVAANLKTKALEFLNGQALTLRETLELSAVDLAYTSANIDSFDLLDNIRVESLPHNISKDYLLGKIEIPLQEPSGTKIILGETKRTLIDSITENEKDVSNRIEYIENDYLVNKDVTQVYEEIEKATTSILQTASDLILSATEELVGVNDFESYKQIINTQFQQTASDFTFLFTEVTEKIDNTNDNVNTEFNKIQKYIRFEDGNIILGEENNELTLKISNDKISFLQGVNEVAYLSKNKLYVTDGHFIKSLGLGNFVFVPRNNGNLSFVYKGGETIG